MECSYGCLSNFDLPPPESPSGRNKLTVPSADMRWAACESGPGQAVNRPPASFSRPSGGMRRRHIIGSVPRTVELITKVDAMTVVVRDLLLQRDADGGADVVGMLMNVKADPGTPVTMVFTFYDQAGNALGTQTTMVTAGAVDTSTDIELRFDSDSQVDGYGYTLSM